ncbi:hypothetical protein [Methylobacterium sp. DCY52]|jgi:hypothetical protein
MTLLAVVLIVYVCRRPLIWVGVQLLAFTAGFLLGWEVMKRR